MDRVEGTLVTAAATIGRWRPVHGELWLVDTGILYRTLDLRRTARQLRKERGQRLPAQTVDPGDRPVRQFASGELDDIAAEQPANRWISRFDVRGGDLRRKSTTTLLRLELAHGERIRLAWPRREQATPAVEAQLRDWLGEQLQSR